MGPTSRVTGGRQTGYRGGTERPPGRQVSRISELLSMTLDAEASKVASSSSRSVGSHLPVMTVTQVEAWMRGSRSGDDRPIVT